MHIIHKSPADSHIPIHSFSLGLLYLTVSQALEHDDDLIVKMSTPILYALLPTIIQAHCQLRTSNQLPVTESKR